MNWVNKSLQYLDHRRKARRWDSFHSPFLFELFTFCCDEKNNHPSFVEIEKERKNLLRSNEVLQRSDFGAGPSNTKSDAAQRISTIAGHALSLPYQCRFMSRLAEFIKARTIVEFGTSFGISASYLSAARPESNLITVEGDPAIATIAEKFFQNLGLKNIALINSTFEAFIIDPNINTPSIELLFLDGNHKSEPLIRYYTALQPFFTTGTVVIVDDIYWSDDMQQGWQQLITRPEITQSVDCYHFGILFFSENFLNKENHRIRLPWRSVFA